jgi:hypothetical protein
MDISSLENLGKVGGIPGIAIGAATLILGTVLALTDIPSAWRGPLLLITILGAIAFAILALVGWMRASRAAPQRASTEGDRSPAWAEDASRSGGLLESTTKGHDSPAVTIRK